MPVPRMLDADAYYDLLRHGHTVKTSLLNTELFLSHFTPVLENGQDVIYVSESGISTPEDVRKLYENGTDAVLVGEMLMRSSDKAGLIKAMKNSGK